MLRMASLEVVVMPIVHVVEIYCVGTRHKNGHSRLTIL